MPNLLALCVSPAQRVEREWMRDHDPTPSLSGRAAAILQVASGQSLRAVGQRGLLRPRRRETVGLWGRRYLADGPASLRGRPGRGRNPAFFPLTTAVARTELQEETGRGNKAHFPVP